MLRRRNTTSIWCETRDDVTGTILTLQTDVVVKTLIATVTLLRENATVNVCDQNTPTSSLEMCFVRAATVWQNIGAVNDVQTAHDSSRETDQRQSDIHLLKQTVAFC